MTQITDFILKYLLNPDTFFGALTYGVVILIIAIILARLIRHGVSDSIKPTHWQPVDRTAMTFISQLAQIGVYLLALVAYFHLIPALHSLGTVLLTGVSVTSIIIGLAAQNTLGNLIAGVSIVLYRPIEIGERVQVSAPTGLETGNIESLNLGYSVLRTLDNRRVIIPNSIMANSVLINLSRTDTRTVASIPITIGHAADIDQARQILLEIGKNQHLAQEVIGCPVTKLEPNTITMNLTAWCANPGDIFSFQTDVLEQTAKRFAAAGIELISPKPLKVVNVRENPVEGSGG